LFSAVFWAARFKKELRDAVDAEIERMENHVKIVHYETIEQNGHKVVLMYDENNNFIAQGETKEQANEIAIKRFPQFSLATLKPKIT
jgi:oligoribonuclease NrnB/cAMP/cGMP phosphodiesterase (DHH superfamily)